MRHARHTAKLGRKGQHRNAMLANMVCSLIKHRRVTTTLAKAKAVRPMAEKMVTLGKKGSIHHRRLAAARLRSPARTLHRRSEDRIAWRENEDVIRILFDEIAPTFKGRPGGYTRIIKLGARRGDAGQKAIIEWVDSEGTEDGDAGTSAPAAEASSSSLNEPAEAPAEAAAGSEEPKADGDASEKKD